MCAEWKNVSATNLLPSLVHACKLKCLPVKTCLKLSLLITYIQYIRHAPLVCWHVTHQAYYPHCIHNSCWLDDWHILTNLRWFLLWLESYWSLCSGIFCYVSRLFFAFTGKVRNFWSDSSQIYIEIKFSCHNHSLLWDPFIMHLQCEVEDKIHSPP